MAEITAQVTPRPSQAVDPKAIEEAVLPERPSKSGYSRSIPWCGATFAPIKKVTLLHEIPRR
jgi:hypothetical protein